MRVKRIKDVRLPERSTKRAAGIDFFVPNNFHPKTLSKDEGLVIHSGILAEIPKGFCLMVQDRSSMALGTRLRVGAKIIDEDFQGELTIHLVNHGHSRETIKPGMRIAQMLLVPVSYEDVREVDFDENLFSRNSERGSRGYGSSDLPKY